MNINITETVYRGISVYQLCCGEMTVCVAPSEGMDICQIQYGEHVILEANLERRAAGGTWGMPVLYPTPNRISGGGVNFDGAFFPMFWKGERLLMHGAARFMAFIVSESAIASDHALLSGYVDFAPGSEAYNYFPFTSRLMLTVRVYENRVEVTHTVSNFGKRDLAFGLAYHPFFNKLGKTRIRTGARSFYVTDENKLPNGELKAAEGEFDLSDGALVDDLDLDHVYTDLPKGENAADIYYDEICMHVGLKTTEDFSHLVVFTPPRPFFCLENQTCSTDVHNLSRICNHTGLQIVLPGSEASGTVTIQIEKM